MNFHIILAIIYVLSAAVFVALSGTAEGLLSPRILLSAFVGVTAAAHILYIIFIFLISLFSKKIKPHAKHAFSIGGILTLVAGYYWGSNIDSAREAESKRRGELILAEVKRYKDANGSCPESLETLEAFSNGIPEPAIHNSSYRYWVSNDGRCTIDFFGPLFISCSRNTEDADWYCD